MSQFRPFHTLTPCSVKILFNISVPYTPNYFSPLGFLIKILYTAPASHTCAIFLVRLILHDLTLQ
jgi:hypothetical protein